LPPHWITQEKRSTDAKGKLQPQLEQLYENKRSFFLLRIEGRQKFTFSNSSDFLIFKSRYLEKGQTLKKVLLFWCSFFL
jgi:hypothetical protein